MTSGYFRIVAVLLVFNTSVFAGGFQINMLGMKATSMAGVATGVGKDASMVFHNPGAMTFQEYHQISAGANFALPSTSYLSPYTSNFDMENKLYTPVHLYALGILNEKMAVGVSVNTPYHQRSKWEDQWAGRYITKENEIKAVYVQPTFGYRLSDTWGVGAGVSVAFGHMLVRKDYPLTSPTGDIAMELDGNSVGFGFNIGLFYQPSDEFSAGINYRSSVKMNVSGDAAFSNVPVSMTSLYPASTSFETDYTLPSVIIAGASAMITRELMICMDINYTFWNVFDSIAYKFKDYKNLNYGTGYYYNNSFAIRLGAQYEISDLIDVRAGVAFDKSPVEDEYVSPENPDADRFMFSLGGSLHFGENIDVDLAYMLQNIKERETNNVENAFGGNYKSLVNIFGITLNYRFIR
jgi:long-chain fatty acid transport protein